MDGMQQLDIDGLVYLNLLGVVITSPYTLPPGTASLAAYMCLPSFDVSQTTTQIGSRVFKHDDVTGRGDNSGRCALLVELASPLDRPVRP